MLVLLLILVAVVPAVVDTSYNMRYKTENMCSYRKYDGGDGSVYPISKIPSIEAKVPTTLLADMFGKATAEWKDSMGFGAGNWLTFASVTATGVSKKLESIAPKLAACLGVFGAGFSVVATELTKITPEQIIEEVNKAITQVVEETNRRFDVFEELIDEKLRDYMKKTLINYYQGQHEVWMKCVLLDTKDRVDACQEECARAAARKRLTFVYDHLYKRDSQTQIKKSDIKAIELQLPILKRFADFHMLVLASLVKTYESDDARKESYALYRDELYSYGSYYIGYMKWAVHSIRKARLELQSKTATVNCLEGYEKDWSFCSFCFGGRLTAKYLDWVSRKCNFKITTMRPEKCDITAKLECPEKSCYIGPGLPWRSEDDRNLGNFQSYCDSHMEDKASEIIQEYHTKLEEDLDTFWDKEITMFLPKIEEIMEEVTSGSSSGGKRTGVTPGEAAKIPKLTEEQKASEKRLEEMKKEREAEEKQLLEGVTSSMSLEEYYARVMGNSEMVVKKAKKAKKAKKLKVKKAAKEKQKIDE